MIRKILPKLVFIALSVLLCLMTVYQRQMFASDKKENTKVEQVDEDSREKLRAFYTAPPVIPHEANERRQGQCLVCHKDIRHISGRISVKTPHPQFSNCLQCHVMTKRNDEVFVKTSWEGLDKPDKIEQAHPYAPPMIPHRIFLRENCLSCHGPKNPNKELRTSHPQRTNCQQCHIVDVRKEFLISK